MQGHIKNSNIFVLFKLNISQVIKNKIFNKIKNILTKIKNFKLNWKIIIEFKGIFFLIWLVLIYFYFQNPVKFLNNIKLKSKSFLIKENIQEMAQWLSIK